MHKLFPPAVWATAFAALIAFMGIGIVDPILGSLLNAWGISKFAVEWLFTSYIAVMSIAMLLSGVLATKFGARRVLLTGLTLVIIFSALSGLAPNIGFLAVFRGGWGLGNAFFTSTALSIIVGASTRGMAAAITLYEAALGLGMASGPLLGGFLGSLHWRFPFFGTSTLMLIGLLFTLFLVKDSGKKEAPRKARDIIRALGHPAVRTNALIGLLYSFVFFTVLAYSPLTPAFQQLGSMKVGVAFFGWGVLVGVSSVFVVNWLRPRLGPLRLLEWNLLCMCVLLIFAAVAKGMVLVCLVVVSGFFCGIANAVFTSMAMEVSPFSRSISSGSYNFLRWAGAALSPILCGWLGDHVGVQAPFWLGAILLLIAWMGLRASHATLKQGLHENGAAGAVHG
ncbi:MFS transporter [Alicyclobacillus contaminans]|uniref:MFS transporter n=1 Tax=Alicyclobacillus contaminans TaxID=392016 RepID=UPI0004798466|nr:MFS transporter [Alicyclobacillus contaminans]